jgi:predicted amidohydrolase YtcJ
MATKEERIALINASVITMEHNHPRAWGVLIADGKIENVLPHPLPKKALGTRRIIDCKGNTVIPGFLDIHCHVRSSAQNLIVIDLSPRNGVKSMDDIKKKILDFARVKPEGTWIKARNYDEFYLKEQRHPTKQDLDKISKTHPIKLTHRTGMIHVLNSLALDLVGISAESEDPEDGLIDRDPETGEPTGLLYGMGKFLSERIPEESEIEIEKAIKRVSENMVSLGITTVCDASAYNDLLSLKMFKEWVSKGLILPHVRLLLGVEGFKDMNHERVRDNSVRIAGIKLVLHESTGRLHPDPHSLNSLVSDIQKRGYPVAIHAFEEEHIKVALQSIGNAAMLFPRKINHRIEHCAVCPPCILDLIERLGVCVVSQPSFLHFNGDRYIKTLPKEKIEFLYPFRSMVRRRILVAASSDSPISPLDPFLSLSALITRKTLSGVVVNEKERIRNLNQALFMHTLAPAKILGEEKRTGSIRPGKDADLIVLDTDIERIRPEELTGVKVQLTIISGEIVHSLMN